MGWADLDNGDLLRTAETDLFELLITTDRSMRYQQNLRGRRIALLRIPQDLDLVRAHAAELLAIVNGMRPGEYPEWR